MQNIVHVVDGGRGNQTISELQLGFNRVAVLRAFVHLSFMPTLKDFDPFELLVCKHEILLTLEMLCLQEVKVLELI